MLEAGTTSLQIHVQVDAAEAARAFNVCKMISAMTVGVAANSPFLFGRQLWQETRIPLFEQAVSVGATRLQQAGDLRYRVRARRVSWSASRRIGPGTR